MDEVARLVRLIGEPIFITIGGADWADKAHLGLTAIAFTLPFIALTLAILALRKGGSE